MKEITVHRRTLRCPVCSAETLVGFAHDLPGRHMDYDRYFLPVPTGGGVQTEFLVPNLTLFNNYVCPADLFVYSGNIRQGDGGLAFDENAFYDFRRTIRADRSEYTGRRVRFFLRALAANGKAPESIARSRADAARLVALAADGQDRSAEIGKLFLRARSSAEGNPLSHLLTAFYKDRSMMTATLEMQLADLLYLLNRQENRRARPLPYDGLYPALDHLRARLAAEHAVHTDLAGDVLFQCLRLLDFFDSTRKHALLQTAFAITRYLTRLNLRIGADLNRKLSVLSINADVLFYLHVRLGRDLGADVEDEAAILTFVERRLEMIGDYHRAAEDPNAVRVVRIGKTLRRLIADLKATRRAGVA